MFAGDNERREIMTTVKKNNYEQQLKKQFNNWSIRRAYQIKANNKILVKFFQPPLSSPTQAHPRHSGIAKISFRNSAEFDVWCRQINIKKKSVNVGEKITIL